MMEIRHEIGSAQSGLFVTFDTMEERDMFRQKLNVFAGIQKNIGLDNAPTKELIDFTVVGRDENGKCLLHIPEHQYENVFKSLVNSVDVTLNTVVAIEGIKNGTDNR